MNARLSHLAALHGIGLEYHDIRGNARHASVATVLALLDAMDVPATSEPAIEASIAAHEAARWCTVIPPALVVAAEESERRIRLSLPAGLDAATLAWRLEEESGAHRSTTFNPLHLSALEHAAIDDVNYIARELVLEFPLPAGYHRLEITHVDAVIGTCLLVAVPRRCYQPPALEGRNKVWGAAVQLYSVRSERNWGIGDYTDLRTIVEQWGGRGAGIVSVNPLHALFPHDPTRASPYSPSSRLFRNVLYLDVGAIEDLRTCEPARKVVRSAAFRAQLKALRGAELVDYAAVATAKLRVLELLFAHFRARHLAADTTRARVFRAFQEEGGEALRQHARFEAMQERFHHDDPSTWGWPAWREPYRDPSSRECTEFATEHPDRIEFFEYLQWQADDQLATVVQCAVELGLEVGIVADLAISVDRGGAEAWANQALYAAGVGIGAPPDDFNATGQNWGLPPMVPERLRAARYAPFIATLRANMRHAGALRIDHVMGLSRLFWVAEGSLPADGAYVCYPFAELLGIVALESHRNRCLVIGEDLGTVPDDVRTALRAAGVLSYRLLYFERNRANEFKPPAEYPEQALAAASTHDLPTLAGWWTGHDIAMRTALGLFATPEVRDAQLLARAQDRTRLLLALEREGLLPAGATADPVSLPEMTPEFGCAIAVYLARSAAQVVVVQLEDVLGLADQANVPGSIAAYPNWRRKLPIGLEHWADNERFTGLSRALAPLRGRLQALRSRERGAETAVIPRATYRLQLHGDFTFAAATAVVPYLAELGVSHVYCSPYLRARPGSRHGYDIVDHTTLNPEIGTLEDFNRFVAALKRHGLGQIADIVPNHMAVMGTDNAWWMDLLENGPASAYAEYFDIDWSPFDPTLAGKVLVPILGDHYGNVLEHGELALAFEPDVGGFALWYHDHRCPIDPREYPRILARVPTLLRGAGVPEQAAADFESLIAAFGHLPPRDASTPDALAERSRDRAVHKRRLAQLAREHPPLAKAIERAVRAVNGSVGERDSFVALDELLEAQAYRLAYWRVAADEINYRRFFHINELAALRVENEAVFEATHRFVLDLAAEGKIDGLRIDHPDGLYDPTEYFRHLQLRYARFTDADRPLEAGARPLYVVVEKIIAPHEHLPESWPVHGTTGYRFANVVTGLFVDTAAKLRLDRTWRAFVRDEATDFDEASYQAKRVVMRDALAGELTVLANCALRIARCDWRTRDFSFNALRRAIAEVVACFPVYRTYIAQYVSVQDRRYIDWAVAHASRHNAAGDFSVFDFLKNVLLVRPPAGARSELEAEYRRFAMHFQQFTAPVMAKGVEDTVFYVFNRLVALNDVGGNPDEFGMPVSAFHGASADRAAKFPHTMLATSTHDSKRSEDVRARIAVISELPAAWRLAVRGWSRINRRKTQTVDGRPAPSRNDEYLLYQTLAGTFPAVAIDEADLAAYRTRIKEYMLKAVREANVRTTWFSPNEEYESATTGFVDALLGGLEGNAFLADFRAQLTPLAWFGALNSLSLALIKFTSPGVPDTYQGQELIELTLVDPDNRRAVDYATRREALASLKKLVTDGADGLPARVQSLLETPYDGRLKLWAAWRILELRRRQRDLFEKGDYHKVAAAGVRAKHVVAYARRLGTTGIVAIAGRLFAGLGVEPNAAPLGKAAWGDTTVDLSFVPAGASLHNVLTGEILASTGEVPLAQIFAYLPGAVLAYDATTA